MIAIGSLSFLTRIRPHCASLTGSAWNCQSWTWLLGRRGFANEQVHLSPDVRAAGGASIVRQPVATERAETVAARRQRALYLVLQANAALIHLAFLLHALPQLDGVLSFLLQLIFCCFLRGLQLQHFLH